MPFTVETISQLGQFAMLVVAVCVGIMLLISLIDRNPPREK